MPLRLAPLSTLVVLSVVLAIALKVGGFGLPLVLILLTWLFKYSFVFLDRLVSGDVEPPVLSVEMVMASVGEWRSLLPLILIIGAFFGTGAATYWAGTTTAMVVGGAALLCLPAMLAVQGWTGAVAQSLNPWVCARMARVLGHDYLWMTGCTLALIALGFVLPHFADGIPTSLRIGMRVYAWLALIAVTGGALRSRRPELLQETVFVIEKQQTASAEAVAREREHWFDSVYASWRSNARENAWRAVQQHIDTAADPLAELRWLYGRAAGWEGQQFASRVLHEMLPRLFAADREGEALMLVRERLAVDPDFRPRDSTHVQRLARVAGEWGDRGTQELLLRETR